MIERLLGIDSQTSLTGGSLHFRTDWPWGVLVLGALAALAAAAFYYRREPMLSRPGRVAMALARTAAIGLLLLMLFRPVLQAQLTRTVRPAVLVLTDKSDSMNIRDARKDPASLNEAAAALGKIPFPPLELPRAARKATALMRQAAEALDAGSAADARDAQQSIADALTAVRATVPRRPGDADDGLPAELEALAGQQAALRQALDAGESLGAVAQRNIAAALGAWKDQAAVAGPTSDDKLKAELALVSRAELVDAAIRSTARPTLDEMARRADVGYFRFARRLTPLADSGSNPPAAGDPEDGGATWLGSAVDAAVEECGDQPVAAVVVLSDGASNGGTDPLDAAWRLRRRGIRLVTVGVGLPEPDDTSLRNLVAPDVVFAGDIVPLRIQCLASGYERRSTTLVARLDSVEVVRKTVSFGAQGHVEELPFPAGPAGNKTLEVELVPLPGEATTKNNVLRRSLRVLDEKIKVLYLEGSPRWEYRYVRAVLKRDPRIDVQFVNTEGDKDLVRASKEHIGRFPEKEEQAFRYDLVILGDVRANTFTPTQLGLLERLVRERGGALIVLAGPKHAPAEYLDTPVASMLPVRVEQEKGEDVGNDVHPVLTPEGRRSTVMALERDEARNQAIWANIKPLNSLPPLLGAKPGAQVLAELSDARERNRSYPLVAWQRYGAGKVMFVGTDQLWRLRARTGDKYHLKFWGQAIQFLTLSRLLGDNGRVHLQTGREEYGLGEPVALFADVLGDLYEPSAAATYTVSVGPVAGGEPQACVLRAMPGLPGMYEGFFAPTAAGRYRLVAPAANETPTVGAAIGRPKDPAAPAAVEFEVRPAAAEQLDTAMHREMLARAAEVTGGEYLALGELPLLGDAIDIQPQMKSFTKDVELWDNALVPLAFVALAAVEWAWRRKRNLA